MRGRILAHRGAWKTENQRNSTNALFGALTDGFGVETDIRDAKSQLVISHDPCVGDTTSIRDLLAFANERHKNNQVIALNIKADGLANQLADVVTEFPNLNIFVFDMSVPEMRRYLNTDLPVFARISEVERDPPWLEKCRGIWADSFEGEWYARADIQRLFKMKSTVCFVSPELHGRPHLPTWNLLREFSAEDGFMLCTDLPHDAARFFEDAGG